MSIILWAPYKQVLNDYLKKKQHESNIKLKWYHILIGHMYSNDLNSLNLVINASIIAKGSEAPLFIIQQACFAQYIYIFFISLKRTQFLNWSCDINYTLWSCDFMQYGLKSTKWRTMGSFFSTVTQWFKSYHYFRDTNLQTRNIKIMYLKI